MDDLLTQFKVKVAGRLITLSEACASNTNLFEVCALTNNFRSWIEVCSEALEVACLEEAKRNFHAILFGNVEPLMQKVPINLLLAAPIVTPPASPVQDPFVTFDPSLEVGSVSGAKKFVITDEFILDNFECVTAINYNMEDQLKVQNAKIDKLTEMVRLLLSRMTPPLKH